MSCEAYDYEPEEQDEVEEIESLDLSDADDTDTEDDFVAPPSRPRETAYAR